MARAYIDVPFEAGGGARKMALALHYVNRIVFSCDIGIGAEIDASCEFYHAGLGVVIHGNAVMGKQCTVMHHVTIGDLYVGSQTAAAKTIELGVPRIGNRCFIGAGATILGDVVVGDGAVIGAGALVLRDVPAGALAVGVPARIIDRGVRP